MVKVGFEDCLQQNRKYIFSYEHSVEEVVEEHIPKVVNILTLKKVFGSIDIASFQEDIKLEERKSQTRNFV